MEEFKIISSCTRADMINDGSLIVVTELAIEASFRLVLHL
jgi:hypothetical protein